MGRPPAAIENRARKIFAGAPVVGRWERHELVKLREYIGAASAAQLAVVFRRTEEAVVRVLTALRSARATSERPFDRDELADFKRLYGNRTDIDLATIFGRKVSMIVRMGDALRLSKDKAFVRRIGGSTKMPRWTETAVTLLRQMYSAHPNQKIAEILHRSIKSVVSKAHILGLKKDEERLRQMGRENVAKRYE